MSSLSPEEVKGMPGTKELSGLIGFSPVWAAEVRGSGDFHNS